MSFEEAAAVPLASLTVWQVRAALLHTACGSMQPALPSRALHIKRVASSYGPQVQVWEGLQLPPGSSRGGST